MLQLLPYELLNKEYCLRKEKYKSLIESLSLDELNL